MPPKKSTADEQGTVIYLMILPGHTKKVRFDHKSGPICTEMKVYDPEVRKSIHLEKYNYKALSQIGEEKPGPFGNYHIKMTDAEMGNHLCFKSEIVILTAWSQDIQDWAEATLLAFVAENLTKKVRMIDAALASALRPAPQKSEEGKYIVNLKAKATRTKIVRADSPEEAGKTSSFDLGIGLGNDDEHWSIDDVVVTQVQSVEQVMNECKKANGTRKGG